MRATLFCIGLAGACFSVAFGEEEPEKYSLAYQFKPGQDVRWKIVHRATIKTTVRGTTQTAQTRTDSVKRWHVTEVTPEGQFVFVHSVDQVKMTNKISGRVKVEYDSLKDKDPPPGFEDVARAIGVPLTEISMGRYGKVTKRIQKLVQPGGNFDPPIAIPLPSNPVAVGAKWNEPHEITVQLKDKRTKPIQVRRLFELKEVKEGIATISMNFQVLTPNEDPSIEAQLIQHLTDGVIRFNLAEGRIESQRITVDRRVLGFSGPASSMHYLMQMDETLNPPEETVATRSSSPAAKAIGR